MARGIRAVAVAQCSGRAERREQRAQQRRQRGLLLSRKGRDQLGLCLEQGTERAVDSGLALGGEAHQHAAAIAGIGQPLDQAPAGEAVDAVGHGAAGHEGLAQEPAGGELVRRTRTPQRGQHVELPRLDVVGGEGVAAGQVEVAGQPGDAAEDLHRTEVEVAALARPGLDQAVHFVAHAASVPDPSRILTSR